MAANARPENQLRGADDDGEVCEHPSRAPRLDNLGAAGGEGRGGERGHASLHARGEAGYVLGEKGGGVG